MKYENIKDAMNALREFQFKQAAIRHAMGVLEYDGETVAPKDSADGRARTMGYLSELSYKMTTDPELFELVYSLDGRKDELDTEEKRMVEIIKKDCDLMTKIPMEEYVQFSELCSKAGDVWKEAKNTSDFALFAPYLEKIVEFDKKLAAYINPEMKPYNALLDMYEDGLTMDTLDAFFGKLRTGIVPLIEAISKKPQLDDSFTKTNFPIPAQREMSLEVMKTMGLNMDRIILGEVEHPFTTGFNLCDERITTHFHEDDMLSNLFSVLHEGGHAIYDMGSKPEYDYTVLCGGYAMSIHESQSRFYENIIGRSKAFAGPLLEICRKYFPLQFEGVTAEMFWKAANKAQPSLIRTEADELTYSLHVMVRYEIEKMLIGGTLQVKDVPETWNRLYKEYLGIDVPDDRQGCLQDSHWSGGSLGYFPSYALGSAYGAQFLSIMEKDVPDMWEKVAGGDLSPVTGWLHDKIHVYGSLYKPGELMDQICGGFDPQYYIDYLTEKYTELYEL